MIKSLILNYSNIHSSYVSEFTSEFISPYQVVINYQAIDEFVRNSLGPKFITKPNEFISGFGLFMY